MYRGLHDLRSYTQLISVQRRSAIATRVRVVRCLRVPLVRCHLLPVAGTQRHSPMRSGHICQGATIGWQAR